MEPLRIIILTFSGIFTFAYGLAWIVPLVAAAKQESESSYVGQTLRLLDLFLIILDCIPIFWLFRAIPSTPSAYRAARDAWLTQSSIRTSFWLSLAALTITLAGLFI